MDNNAGFQEVEHTADWELEVWAPNFSGLLEQAAHGMMTLLKVQSKAQPRQLCSFTVVGDDQEALLVAFLSELLFMVESEGIAFDIFNINVNPGSVEVNAEGAPVANQGKEIKAVTYHNLEVRHTKDGLRVNLVFDV